MARYQVARMTVRQALAELQREGLAVARRGSGVYVSDFQPIVRDELRWLASMPWVRGEPEWQDRDADEISVEELGATTEETPRYLADALDVPTGTRARLRTRRFMLGGREVMFSVARVPEAIAVRADPDGTCRGGPAAMYARLAEIGLTPTRFREDVRARLATAEEAERFAIPAGAPVLVVQRVAFCDDLPVEVTETVLDAGVYVLRYDFPARGPGPAG